MIRTIAGNGQNDFGDGGPATATSLDAPLSVAVDGAGNVYLVESRDRARMVSAATGIITTIAGGGIGGDGAAAIDARLFYPGGIAVDAAGDVYIAESARVRKVDAVTKIITTVAGGGESGLGDGGPAIGARLAYPAGVTFDANGNLYIADSEDHRIRKVDAATQVITTIVGKGLGGFEGDGGTANAAQLNRPMAVVLDSAGNLYIADTLNNRVRKVAVPQYPHRRPARR